MRRQGPDRPASNQPHRPSKGSPGYISAVLSEIRRTKTSSGREINIDACCRRLVAGAEVEVEASLLAATDRGLPVERLVEEVLPACAARLGEMWMTDRAGFGGVTLGMTALHGILRKVWDRYTIPGQKTARPARVLLLTAQDESHVFAPLLMTAILTRRGHRIEQGFPKTIGDLEEMLAGRRFDVIGISASCDAGYRAARRMMPTLRRMSAARVMLGGSAARTIMDKPEAAEFDFVGTERVEVLDFISECGERGPLSAA